MPLKSLFVENRQIPFPKGLSQVTVSPNFKVFLTSFCLVQIGSLWLILYLQVSSTSGLFGVIIYELIQKICKYFIIK